MKKCGFTLIELLVVIAILSTLAAILFPVLAQAREKGRQSGCLSNAKALALAVSMYAQDYDDVMPPGAHQQSSSGLRWGGLIQPYVKNLAIFTCPSAPDAIYKGATGPTGGYGYNACFLDFTPAAKISKPSEMILLGDSCGVINTYPFLIRPDAASQATWCSWSPRPDLVARGIPCPAPGQSSYPMAQLYRLAYRHLARTNIAFVDGHVKPLRYEQVNRQADTEEGTALVGRERSALWNVQ